MKLLDAASQQKLNEWLEKFYKKEKAKIFPEVVGVSIDQSGIAVAHVEITSAKEAIVHSCVYLETKESEEQQDFLTKYVANYQLDGLPASYALPVSEYTLSMIEQPKGTKKEVKDELPKVIEEFINEPVAKITVDAFSLPLKRVSDNQKVMYAAAMKSKLVPTIEGLVNSSGMLLRFIDIQEMCLRNLASLYPESKEGCAMVYLHEAGGEVIILKDGEVFATRTLDMPLQQLTAQSAMRSEFEMEGNEEEVLDNLASNLELSIDYCINTFSDAPANTIILASSVIDLEKIKQYLQKQMQQPVMVLDLTKHIKFKTEVSLAEKQNCMFAIGAGLRFLTER